MGEALTTLLTISAGGTLLALLLFALGKLLGRRLPRAAYYYLWLLVLLRLLLPWGSRLSLLGGEAGPPRAAVLSDAPAEGLWLPEGVDAPAAGSVAPGAGAAGGAGMSVLLASPRSVWGTSICPSTKSPPARRDREGAKKEWGSGSSMMISPVA